MPSLKYVPYDMLTNKLYNIKILQHPLLIRQRQNRVFAINTFKSNNKHIANYVC